MRKTFCFLFMLLPLLMNAEEARLLRFPSVGGDKIAFTYAGDLYTVSIDGGQATKLTSHIGYETFSRFSPDGKTIAFTGQYDGNTEVYLIPSEGGVPQRLTYTATLDRDDIGDRMGPNNIVMCWTPDGKDVVFRTRWYTFSGLRGLLYHAPVDGSDLRQIPTTEGGFCSYSPDGKKLALNRMFREFRTWKYYRGGQADDIWINTVGTTELVNITNNPAQDIFPMWVGEKIFFLSDRDHTMNLFCYDVASGQTRKVTDFKEYDCKFPSYSQEYVVFENGGYIYKYNIAADKCEKVNITLSSDGVYARGKLSDAPSAQSAMGMYRGGFSLSPDGERVLATHRGDIFNLPATKGATYQITSSSSSQEREPVWSPDGNKIAYFSDASGEYQVYVADAANPASAVKMTNFKTGYPQGLTWAPDSKTLYFSDEKKNTYSLDVESKKLTKIFYGKFGGMRGYDISPDGAWLAYSASAQNNVSVVYLYNVAQKKHYPVTTTWYDSYSPVFSADGKYLFFTSAREFQSRYSRVEWNAAYDISNYIFVVPLAKATPAPTLLKGDEYTPGTPAGGNKPASGKPGAAPAPTPAAKTVVDTDGLIERAAVLPIGSGRFGIIGCWGDHLYYTKGGETCKLSLKDMKESKLGKDRVITTTPDYKKALVMSKGALKVVSTNSFKGEATVPTSDMRVSIDYAQEWKQIYDETWRVFRDHFYLENMHGKDWDAIHDKYAVMLPYVQHRQDLTYLIGEMIAELNIGHAYVTTGEAPRAERIKVGLLGGQFAKDKSGYFQVTKIFQGEDWSKTNRSPLAEPGLGVKVGDYVLAVNGKSLKDVRNIYETLVGKVGSMVALKVNTTPSEEGARTIYVKPIADETQLAYYEWVHNNIRKVDEMSGGQIGYIHIPDMSTVGLDEFTKLFYTQLDKKALIIDDRMNGGGNVSPMIIERLQREVYRMNMYRNGSEGLATIPESTHHGPKVCLVDKYSSSDGDLFPYGFQKLGIGPLIGTRTWGGIVGISGSKPYVDGQDVRTPFFTSYSTDGKWILENEGVTPDIYVDINPFEDYLGNDAQLNKAVEVLLEQIKTYPQLPGVPAPRVMD